MSLQDLIVEEFVHTKSISALIYLIDNGRELEFSLYGKKYFISRDQSQKYASLWGSNDEQGFDSMEELIENAVVADSPLLTVLPEIQIETIF